MTSVHPDEGQKGDTSKAKESPARNHKPAKRKHRRRKHINPDRAEKELRGHYYFG